MKSYMVVSSKGAYALSEYETPQSLGSVLSTHDNLSLVDKKGGKVTFSPVAVLDLDHLADVIDSIQNLRERAQENMRLLSEKKS